MTRRLAVYICLALAIAALDFLTKRWVEAHLMPGEVIPITPFLNLVLTYNPGAAFSFLSDASGWQRELFIGIALSASILIVYLMYRHWEQALFCLALGLILGGALGNLWDRVALGAVADFLDFHYAGWHWPAFNLADSAISCGAALLIWDAIRTHRRAAHG